jgi:hypothetical protein
MDYTSPEADRPVQRSLAVRTPTFLHIHKTTFDEQDDEGRQNFPSTRKSSAEALR